MSGGRERLGRYELIEVLADVMLFRGPPENIRSDNGPEFVAKELRQWLTKVGTGTLYIEPGSPWGTVTARASTGSCGMNPETERFSTQ